MTKRSGQWFGDSVLKTVLAGGTTADVIQLLPTVASLQSARDIVFERAIISFQIHRLTAGALSGHAWVVWKGLVLAGTSTPVEGVDPLNVGATSQFSWGRKAIMQYGPLDVPATLILFDSNTKVTDSSVVSSQVDFDVKRSVSRANEFIGLQVSADASSVLQTLVTWRVYYTYAA